MLSDGSDDAAYGIVEDDESGEGYSDFDDDVEEMLKAQQRQAEGNHAGSVEDDGSDGDYSDDSFG